MPSLASLREPEVSSLIFFSTTAIINLITFTYLLSNEEEYSTPKVGPLKLYQIIFILQGIIFLISVVITRRIAAGGKFHHHLTNSGTLSVRLKNGKNAEITVKDKLVFITGGNTGIGYATALNFAKWGSKVVIGCRDNTRGEKAAENLRRVSRNEQVEFVKVDLASFSSIRKFAKEWEASGHEPIDILINNAGIMMCPFGLTEDGFELQFGTNHLGHFLLTKLLLPHINPNSGRIINLSSFGHHFAPNSTSIDYHSLTERNKASYNSVVAYGITKLCNIYFTRQLQVELRKKKTNILVCAVHPGGVKTELTRHFSAILQNLLTPVLNLLLKTPDQGAQTSLFCAVHPEVIPAEYYSDCRIGQQTAQTRNEAEWARLWSASEEIVDSR